VIAVGADNENAIRIQVRAVIKLDTAIHISLCHKDLLFVISYCLVLG